MAKINKEEEWRRSGMAYALMVAKEKGIEGLEEEIKFRNITKCPIGISRQKFIDLKHEIALNCIDTVMVMGLLVLNDEFGFTKEDLLRFKDKIMTKSDCLANGYSDWNETLEILEKECEIKLDLPKAFTMMKKRDDL